MAENFAMLEYKTQEEVMTVVKYLTSFLSTTGVQILEVLSPSHLLTQLHEPLPAITLDNNVNEMLSPIYSCFNHCVLGHSSQPIVLYTSRPSARGQSTPSNSRFPGSVDTAPPSEKFCYNLDHYAFEGTPEIAL